MKQNIQVFKVKEFNPPIYLKYIMVIFECVLNSINF